MSSPLSSSRGRRALRPCVVAAAAVYAAGLTATASAQSNFVWDGGGGGLNGTTLWETQNNWNPNGLPGSGDNVTFGTSFPFLRINAFGNRTVNSVTINTSANFELANFGGTGNTITIANGNLTRTAASSGTQTISSALHLGASAAWAIHGTGGLVVSGPISLPANTSFGKIGSGLVTLTTASSTFGGLVSIDGGEFRVGANATMNVQAPSFVPLVVQGGGTTLSVRDGGRIDSDNTLQIGGDALLSVAGANSKLETAASAAVFVGQSDSGRAEVLDGGLLDAGGLYISSNLDSQGTLRVAGGGTARARFVTIGNAGGTGGGTATVTGANSRLEATTELEVGESGSGLLTISNGGAVVANDLGLGVGDATIVVNGGTLRTNTLRGGGAGGLIRLTADPAGGQALDIQGTNVSSTFSGTILGAGSIRKRNTGTMIFTGLVGHTGETLVEGGVLELANGAAAGGTVRMAGGTLRAQSVVARPLAGTNGTVAATGSLAIGNPANANAIDFGGILNVGAHSVMLLDADAARLTGATSLGAGGRLDSFAGIVSTGTVNVAPTGSATIDGRFVNNGTVNGPTAAGQRLTFEDDVTGAGSFTGNVLFSDVFSPGNSPAAVSLAFAELDAGARLLIELAGTTPGTGHDRLNATGGLTLDGTLDVVLLNAFTPQLGQSFTLLNGPLSGMFDEVNLPTLATGLRWETTRTATAYTISVVPEPAGIAVFALGGALALRRARDASAATC